MTVILLSALGLLMLLGGALHSHSVVDEGLQGLEDGTFSLETIRQTGRKLILGRVFILLGGAFVLAAIFVYLTPGRA